MACVDELNGKSESEIKDKTPIVLSALSNMTDSDFVFSLEYFKNKLEGYNSVAIKNATNESKEAATQRISTIRQNSFILPENANKLKNS